jgi:hypothetical protein
MSHAAVRPLIAALLAAACAVGAGSALAATKKPKPAPAQPAPLVDLNEEQLANAERVLTGPHQCEFNQTLAVEGATEKAGYFRLQHKGKKYLLVPEPTTTGAVRLEDKKAGVVWLQIANKSMLMNAKIGQRMVDECIHPAQHPTQQAPVAAQAS